MIKSVIVKNGREFINLDVTNTDGVGYKVTMTMPPTEQLYASVARDLARALLLMADSIDTANSSLY